MRFREIITELRQPNAAWFAGSQVVDDEGNPLLVYHGTFAKFAKFSHGNKNGMTMPRRGFYFSDKPEAAQEFGDAHGYYLAIKRPADFRDAYGRVGADIITRALATDPELAERVTQAVEDHYGPGLSPGRLGRIGLLQTDDFLAALIRIGHDGMFFEDDFAGHDFTSYVAFDPHQIKRATSKPLQATDHWLISR
jgi:hypothetical protein